MTTVTRNTWFRAGDANAFFALMLDNVANLVILKWTASSPGTLDAPVAPASVAPAAFRSCTAPCETVIGLFGAPNDTNSSPYYDYVGDQLWVGAANGTVHKFTGIFNGTPAEAGAPWPVTVAAGRVLSSPVYDQDHELIFVGSARETAAVPTGGRLHSVSNTDGSVSSSSLLAGDLGSGSTGVADAPMLDSMAKRVYARLGVSGAALLLPIVYLGGFGLWLVAFSFSTAKLGLTASLKIIAVMLVGNWRTAVLYSCTDLM